MRTERSGLLRVLGLLAAGLLWAPGLWAVPGCVPEGQWLRPADGSTVTGASVIAAAGKASVVLLGEHHDNAAHHVWQSEVLRQLADLAPRVVVGLEMLPRSAQPALDGWRAGSMDLAGLAKLSAWDDYWSYGIELYRPVLTIARERDIPLRALNIDKRLVRQVAEQGWGALSPADRDGLPDPAPPSRAYLYVLAASFRSHGAGADDSTEQQRFARFVEVQQLWDNALADGIIRARGQQPAAQVVALMGSGHIAGRHGVVAQLTARGVTDVAVLIPWDEHLRCEDLQPGYADAVFGAVPAL